LLNCHLQQNTQVSPRNNPENRGKLSQLIPSLSAKPSTGSKSMVII
jgi:hypothetical protein